MRRAGCRPCDRLLLAGNAPLIVYRRYQNIMYVQQTKAQPTTSSFSVLLWNLLLVGMGTSSCSCIITHARMHAHGPAGRAISHVCCLLNFSID